MHITATININMSEKLSVNREQWNFPRKLIGKGVKRQKRLSDVIMSCGQMGIFLENHFAM